MSVQYATASELASYLQKDLDTATAVLTLQVASQLFSVRACTAFSAVSLTYQVLGQGYWQLQLPFRPIISVSAVRSIGMGGTVTITDYTRIKTVMYRLAGFGVPGMFPPDLIEVDLIHGYAVCPDDVKGAVLETAAGAYVSPDTTTYSEAIDDYSVKTAPRTGGVMLSESAALLADRYRGTISA